MEFDELSDQQRSTLDDVMNKLSEEIKECFPCYYHKQPLFCRSIVHNYCRDAGWKETKIVNNFKRTADWRKDSGANTFRFWQSVDVFGYDLKDVENLYNRDLLTEKDTLMDIVNAVNRAHTAVFYKWDKHGHPIWLERVGKMDVVAFYHNVDDLKLNTYDAFMHAHMARMETAMLLCAYQSVKLNKPITKATVIWDSDGLNMSHFYWPTLLLLKATLENLQTHYPESAHRVFCINSPTIVVHFWKVIRPWLNERFRQRIEFMGKDFLPRLLEEIDRDCIPEYLGGSCPIPVPLPRDLKMVTVGAKTTETRSIKLKKGEGTNWNISTIANDIKLNVHFQPDNTNEEIQDQVIINERSQSSQGQFIAPTSGELFFKFDNTYSYFKTKKIKFKLNSMNDDSGNWWIKYTYLIQSLSMEQQLALGCGVGISMIMMGRQTWRHRSSLVNKLTGIFSVR